MYCQSLRHLKDLEIDPNNIDLEYAKQLIEAGDPYALKTFKVKDKILNIKNGDYGPYIHIVSGSNKKQFISIPKEYSIDSITIDDVLKIIANKNGTSKSEPSKPSYSGSTYSKSSKSSYSGSISSSKSNKNNDKKQKEFNL